MLLYESARAMIIAKGYELQELASLMEQDGFLLFHAVTNHPFYGTSIAFVAKVNPPGVFLWISLRNSHFPGHYGIRVLAVALPSFGRIVNVIDFRPEQGIVLSHDVRTAAGVKGLRDTMQSISEPARTAVAAVADQVLAKTLDVRRAFSNLASSLPGELFDLTPLISELRATASESQKRTAQKLMPSPLRLAFNTEDELKRTKVSYEIATLMVGVMQARRDSDELLLSPQQTEDCVEFLASWLFNPWLFRRLDLHLPIWSDN